MSEGISQSDLDALFGDVSFGDSPAEPKKTKDNGEGLSQSDLDALFGDMSFGDSPAEPTGELKLEDAWENPPATEANKGEIMSQDEIDAMLAMFGK